MGVGGPPMKCTKCGGDQIEKMFPSRTDNGKTRRRKWCRNCKTRHSTTTRRQKHKDDPAFHEMQKKKCRESATIRGKELRLKALLHYGNGEIKCHCCGETILEFLTLDHINNDGNIQRRTLSPNIKRGMKSTRQFYSWLFRNNYPPGLVISCWNCNCCRGVYGYSPHKKVNSNQGEQNDTSRNFTNDLERDESTPWPSL